MKKVFKGFMPVKMCGLSPLASFYFGALKVGREPEWLRHYPILTNAQTPFPPPPQKKEKKWGREGLGSRIRKDLLKQQIHKDQLKTASMRCNLSHKISKRCLLSPYRSRRLKEETTDRIGSQFNFP